MSKKSAVGEADPSLISMFMAAIGDFSQGFDSQRFNSLFLKSESFNIVTSRYLDLLGIFFLTKVDINNSILQSIGLYMSKFYETFQPQIHSFLNGGAFDSDSISEETIRESVQNLCEVFGTISRK